MFDSKPVMEETEAVVVAEGVGLSPMDTETEAAEVKIHVQVEEVRKLAALPLSDNPDFAEQQAVSGHKDQTESHNVVAGSGGDVQNEELLKSGDNNYNDDGLMDFHGNIYVADLVDNLDEIVNYDELCRSPSAEVKVEPQDGSDGVGVDNEQTATGEVGENPEIWFDNSVPGTETLEEEEQAAFVKEVEAFYKENQLEFRHPKFYKEGLNLFKLWNAVKNLGGYERVTSRKLWKQVGDLFNPPKTCTTVSWTFRHFYEKALLEFEKHKMLDTDVSAAPDGTQAPGSSRATGVVAAHAPDNSEVCHPIIKDKSWSPAPKSTSQANTSGSLKRKRPSAMDCGPGVELQFGTMLCDSGALTNNVMVKDNSYEVYALIPGFLRDEVNVHAHPDGRVVISGKPKVLNDRWGVAPFKKVVRLPSPIDPSKISAVLTERLQLYVRVPFETSDVSEAI